MRYRAFMEFLGASLVLVLSQLVLIVYSLVEEGSFLATDMTNMLLTSALVLLRASLWAFLLAVVLYLVRSSVWRCSVLILSTLVYAFLWTSEFILLAQQGSLFSHSMAVILLSSNPQETQEFMSSTLSLRDVLVPVFLLIGIILVVYGALYRGRTFCSRMYEYCSRHKRGLSVVGIGFLFLQFGLLMPRIYVKATKGIVQGRSLSTMDRFVWCMYSAIQEGRAVQEYLSMLDKKMDLQILPPPSGEVKYNVVLILGESLRRDYMQVYGFPLKNTPYLDSLVSHNHAIALQDVESPASSTILSLQHVLTLKRVEDAGRWFEYPSILLFIRDAGYTSAWYSNQEASGYFMQGLSALAHLADTCRFVVRPSMDEDQMSMAPIYDEELLKCYDPRGREQGKNYFDIIHLQGSHYTYKARYPKHFERFTAQDMPAPMGAKKDSIRAHYVNSVYYNDYILSQLIKRYEDTPTLVCYIADHGEVLYDDANRPNYIGHGGEIVPQGVQIPMIIYVNDALRVLKPELLAKVRAAQDKPFMTDLLLPSLLRLVGVNSKLFHPEQDVFDDNYDSSRLRRKIANEELQHDLD